MEARVEVTIALGKGKSPFTAGNWNKGVKCKILGRSVDLLKDVVIVDSGAHGLHNCPKAKAEGWMGAAYGLVESINEDWWTISFWGNGYFMVFNLFYFYCFSLQSSKKKFWSFQIVDLDNIVNSSKMHKCWGILLKASKLQQRKKSIIYL